MARMTADDLERRLDAKQREEAPSPPPAPALPAVVAEPEVPATTGGRKAVREGLTFTGFYINEMTAKHLRDLVYRSEGEKTKQDFFREALNLLFKKHGLEQVRYDKPAKGKSR